MELTLAFVSLGSNLGQRQDMIAKADQAISELKNTKIHQRSRVIETPPLLYEKQNNFLNQIIGIETFLGPHELLRELQSIERKLGRIRRFRYGPREIDLDILNYGQLHYVDSDLTLPHPAVGSRPYISQLLADLGLDCQDLLLR